MTRPSLSVDDIRSGEPRDAGYRMYKLLGGFWGFTIFCPAIAMVITAALDGGQSSSDSGMVFLVATFISLTLWLVSRGLAQQRRRNARGLSAAAVRPRSSFPAWQTAAAVTGTASSPGRQETEGRLSERHRLFLAYERELAAIERTD